MALVILAFAAIVIAFAGIVPFPSGLLLIGVLIWFAVPGVLLGRRLYGGQPGGWPAAFLAGPAWGYVLSSLALLGLWAGGVRSFRWLMLAPIFAALMAWPFRRLASNLSVPRIGRRDVGACALVLLSVVAIVGLPYAHIGEDLPEGRAYRAYFSADFVWEMAVVAEVSKGDMPPQNPYYLNDVLHYYWLMHLLPAAEHRAMPRAFSVEQLLLVNALSAALAFGGFFYFFVRHFVDRPWPAALACVGVLCCSSFEGLERLIWIWQADAHIGVLRTLNIDAVANWFYQGMKIDGVHRLLLYQPQHEIGYLLGFSALLLIVQARDCSRAALMFLCGLFLGMSLLFSSFAAGIFAIAAAAYESARLIAARRWKAFLPCALAAAVPLGAALALGIVLQYVDPVDGGNPPLTFGLNPLAGHRVGMSVFLNFGPVLIVAVAGLVAVLWRRMLPRFVPLFITLAVCTLAYFYVDVPDVQNVYVGFNVGKLIFVGLAPFCGVLLIESRTARGWRRSVTAAFLIIVALAGLPTVLIDLYNTQDIWNREPGPGFRWTVLLSPKEMEGLEWIKEWTPLGARVQVEPTVRGRDTWAYIPAFARRRMSAGLPISMVPLAKYEKASEQVQAIYQATSVQEAFDRSASICTDFLVIGGPERRAYPRLQPLLDGGKGLFSAAFRNDAFAIYYVLRDRDQECSAE